MLKDRKGKSGGFSGARLGGTDDVFSRKGYRNRLRLDRGGFLEPKILNGLKDRRRKAERGKIHSIS